MGEQLGSKACHNLWIHDGSKDLTVNRYYYRSLLKDSLDQIFAVKCPNVKDGVESKVFGVGLESFTVGSHEFYMGYAVQNGLMATLDMGHFHPTEETYDKISSMLLFTPEVLLHVSRPVRWDSDHVVILNDSVALLAQEIRMGRCLESREHRAGLLRRIDQPYRRLCNREPCHPEAFLQAPAVADQEAA